MYRGSSSSFEAGVAGKGREGKGRERRRGKEKEGGNSKQYGHFEKLSAGFGMVRMDLSVVDSEPEWQEQGVITYPLISEIGAGKEGDHRLGGFD